MSPQREAGDGQLEGIAAARERFGALLGAARATASRLLARPLELLTVAALVGGLLLVSSEFLDLFEIETRGLVVKEQGGGAHHSYAVLVIGVAAIGATLLARASEQWPPALGVAALGLLALAIALIADLPDATRTDLVRGARIADARPALGFWVELAGAIVTLFCGAALAYLLHPRGRAGGERAAARHREGG